MPWKEQEPLDPAVLLWTVQLHVQIFIFIFIFLAYASLSCYLHPKSSDTYEQSDLTYG